MSTSLRIKPDHALKVIHLLEELCKTALMEDAGLTEDQANTRLKQELDFYRQLTLEEHTIADVFHRFCISLANRDRLWNLIFGTRFTELDLSYGSILVGYDPKSVIAKYHEQEELLLADLLEVRLLPGDKTERQKTNPRSQFRLYARGILAGAVFFAPFADGAAFKQSFEEYLSDPEKVAVLPDYFCNLCIPGFGRALASDFLKEIGVKEFGKPDRWVYRFMTAAGWITEEAVESDIQRVFWDLWKILGPEYPPVITDKLIFLAGSGSYVMVEPTYSCESRWEAFEAGLQDFTDGPSR